MSVNGNGVPRFSIPSGILGTVVLLVQAILVTLNEFGFELTAAQQSGIVMIVSLVGILLIQINAYLRNMKRKELSLEEAARIRE